MSEQNTRAARRKKKKGSSGLMGTLSVLAAFIRPKKHTNEKPTKAELKKRWKKGTVGHILLSVLTVILAILAAVYALLAVAFLGPSPAFSTKLANTLLETSAMQFVPKLYLSDEEIQQIIEGNSVLETNEETDVSLIVISRATPAPDGTIPEDGGGDAQAEEEELQLVDIRGGTYTGYALIVKDPSRVFVGTCADSFSVLPGLTLDKLAQRYHATAAINAGGFSDNNGQGNGGTPLGLVISQGRLKANNANLAKYNTVIGFDNSDRLIIGHMDVEQAKARGIRDAVAFGPVLVRNGEAADVSGQSSGLNPRTCIGQRADGAVILMVIDGRQPNSLGASFENLIQEMLALGAVNAANLDGGSSSFMYYNGKYMNNGFAIVGAREIPTAFCVK